MTGLLHIVLARKPIEGTVAENCLQWGCGAINIDGCRVGWDTKSLALDQARRKTPRTKITGGSFHSGGGKSGEYDGEMNSPSGRWPANLILGHCESCVYRGTKKVKAVLGGNSGHVDGKNVYGKYGQTKGNGQTVGYADAEGKEIVEDWDCEKDCVVSIIGEQSGIRKTTCVSATHQNNRSGDFLGQLKHPGEQGYNDTGTAARFFFNFSEQEADE